MARLVFDTGTLVSAFLFPQSVPGQALDLALASHRLVISLDVAMELAEVMRREKFDRFLARRRREELVASTIRECEFVVTSTIVKHCRDAKDDMLLELAIDGRAAAIVTGDADLLSLHPFQGIVIITPREFIAGFAAD